MQPLSYGRNVRRGQRPSPEHCFIWEWPKTLLAHGGWVASWELWQQPMELLSDQWRCVSYDHRGAGLSVVPIEQITLQGCVDDVIGVMDALGIKRCIIAGKSLGAPIVISALLRHPERFEGLVIVDGVPPSTKAKQAAEAPQPEANTERPDYEAVVAAFVDRSYPSRRANTCVGGGGRF